MASKNQKQYIIKTRKFTKEEIIALDNLDIQKKIEAHLICMRIPYEDLPKSWNSYDSRDPFLIYQEGRISKRKLIEYLAKYIVKDLNGE